MLIGQRTNREWYDDLTTVGPAREAAVAERRHVVDMATQSVAQIADPQTEAAIKLVAWLSHGLLKPEPDDFVMLRLVLLALLPQLGGILLMVGRRA